MKTPRKPIFFWPPTGAIKRWAIGLVVAIAIAFGAWAVQTQTPAPSARPVERTVILQEKPDQPHVIGGAATHVPPGTIPAQLAMLPPGDQAVEVWWGHVVAPPILGLPESLDELIEAWTPRADAVVVVRITDRTGRLNVREDWVESTVSAQVVRVLNDPDGRLQVGGAVSFEEDGGSMTVAGRRIFTVHPFAESTQIGRDYLTFLFLLDGRWRIDAGLTFEVEQGRAARRLRPTIAVTGQREIERVDSNVRSAAQLPRRRGGQ